MKLTTKTRKKYRIRNRLKKVSDKSRYRLTVYRSLNNISAQIIDDNDHKTLVAATSNTKSLKTQKKNKSELSKIIAEQIANDAKKINISKIYFDRGIYKYHGRIKVFAETLRKNGMEF